MFLEQTAEKMKCRQLFFGTPGLNPAIEFPDEPESDEEKFHAYINAFLLKTFFLISGFMDK